MAENDRLPAMDHEQRRHYAVLTLSQVCNTVSYQLLFTGFLVLYAARLGLSAAMIGILFFLIQAPVPLQMPLARWLDSHGALRLVRASLRYSPLGVLPMILAPQASAWAGSAAGQAELILGVLLYCVLVQPFGAAWFPLLRANLPAVGMTELIGRMNRASMAVGVVATVGASLYLGRHAAMFQYQVILSVAVVVVVLRGFSFTGLRDVALAPAPPREPIWAGLRQALAERPFRRLLILILIMTGTACISSSFRPLLFRGIGFSERFAAMVTVPVGMASYALTARWWGAVAGRHGTKGVYGMAGWGTLAGHVLLALIPGPGTLGAVMAIAGVALNWGCWGGVDSGNIRRLFGVVPKAGASFHMAVFTLAISVSAAFGALFGGLIASAARPLLGAAALPWGLGVALDYRILYLISAAGSVAAIAYSRRMMPVEEVPAERLLLYLRIRTQRALASGITGMFLRRPPSDEGE